MYIWGKCYPLREIFKLFTLETSDSLRPFFFSQISNVIKKAQNLSMILSNFFDEVMLGEEEKTGKLFISFFRQYI